MNRIYEKLLTHVSLENILSASKERLSSSKSWNTEMLILKSGKLNQKLAHIYLPTSFYILFTL